MARHRKATMSSRLDRRRAGPSRVLIGGAGASLRCAAARPKKGKQKNRTVAGGPPGPDEQVASNRADTFQVIRAGPSLALPCGHTDGSPGATSTSGLGAATETLLTFFFIPGDAIRRRNGNGPPPRPGCRGADPILSGELDAGPSDPFAGTLAEIARVPDRDGFPRKSASYRHAGTSC